MKVVFFGGSDFHLDEYVHNGNITLSGNCPPAKTSQEDYNICLLAGDIAPLKKPKHYITWFEVFCSRFDLVVYVAGNHEAWKGTFDSNFQKAKVEFSHITNLKMLATETYEFKVNEQKVIVVGATLWANTKQNSYADNYFATIVEQGTVKINDFKRIKHKQHSLYRSINCNDYQQEYLKHRDFLVKESNRLRSIDDAFKILITHHSPTLKSINQLSDNYDEKCDAFYATDLEKVVVSGGYDFALHGHIHRANPFKININGTDFISNTSDYSILGKPNCFYELIKIASIDI